MTIVTKGVINTVVKSNCTYDVELGDVSAGLVNILSRTLINIVPDRPFVFRFTSIPQVYYSARVDDRVYALEEELMTSVDAALVDELFTSISSDASSPLLSASYSSDGAEGELCLNFQKRFNRYENGWGFDPSFVEISPKRKAFLRAFEKYPNATAPEWVTALYWEDKVLEDTLSRISPEEVFYEAIPNSTLLGAGDTLQEVWDVITEFYDYYLRDSVELLMYFVDIEFASKQGKALKTSVEDPTKERFLREAFEYFSVDELISLGEDPYLIDTGFTDYSGALISEIDDLLDDVATYLVRLQTVERFPDLGF